MSRVSGNKTTHTHTLHTKRKRQWFKQNPERATSTINTRENRAYYHMSSCFRLSFSSYFQSRSGIQLYAVVQPSLLPQHFFHVKCSAFFRPLLCPSASFPLLLCWSRPLVGVDAENSQVVQETPHPLVFMAPHTARVRHRHNDALRGDVSCPPWAQIRKKDRFPEFHKTFIWLKSPRCSYFKMRNRVVGRRDSFFAPMQRVDEPGTRADSTSRSHTVSITYLHSSYPDFYVDESARSVLHFEGVLQKACTMRRVCTGRPPWTSIDRSALRDKAVQSLLDESASRENLKCQGVFTCTPFWRETMAVYRLLAQMSRCIHVYPFLARNHGGVPSSGVCPKII